MAQLGVLKPAPKAAPQPVDLAPLLDALRAQLASQMESVTPDNLIDAFTTAVHNIVARVGNPNVNVAAPYVAVEAPNVQVAAPSVTVTPEITFNNLGMLELCTKLDEILRVQTAILEVLQRPIQTDVTRDTNQLIRQTIQRRM